MTSPLNGKKMLLKLYTENDSLKELYKKRAQEHNESQNDNPYFNAGFDLLCPESYHVAPDSKLKLNTEVVCAGFDASLFFEPMCYYMYPRSSISKTPLRLANSVGVIDAGYRGNLIGMFDHIGKEEFVVEKHSRLLQVCAPDLRMTHVEVVDSLLELGETMRGSGGFGSTGK